LDGAVGGEEKNKNGLSVKIKYLLMKRETKKVEHILFGP